MYGSQEKERLLPYTPLRDWFLITEVQSVDCAVRTESLYNTDKFRPERVNVVRSKLSSAALKWD